MVAGGPPCQGFSHSNSTRRDPKDPRNSLFIEFLQAVGAFGPTMCVMENVKGLLSTRDARGHLAIDTILRAFDNIGYDADFRLLNAVNYGVPQQRERLIIVATRTKSRIKFSWPRITHYLDSSDFSTLSYEDLQKAVTLWDAISDLPNVDAKTDSLEYATKPTNAYQELMRAGATHPIANHEPMRHTARIRARFSQLTYGESEAHAVGEHRPRLRSDNAKIGTAYGQNSRRQRPDSPCNTVVASSHTNFIHPYLHRNFTVRELARVQSFPDRFTFRGKRAVLSRSLSAKKGYIDDLFLDQRAQVGMQCHQF